MTEDRSLITDDESATDLERIVRKLLIQLSLFTRYFEAEQNAKRVVRYYALGGADVNRTLAAIARAHTAAERIEQFQHQANALKAQARGEMVKNLPRYYLRTRPAPDQPSD